MPTDSPAPDDEGLIALKHPMARALAPVVGSLLRIGVRPNAITLTNIVFCLLVGGWGLTLGAGQSPLYSLFVVAIALRFVLNILDGALARSGEMETPQGALLNEAGDVLCEAALLAPLLGVPGVPPVAVFSVFVLAAAIERTGRTALELGAPRRRDGFAGKPERALLLAVLYLGLAFRLPFGWATVALASMVLLSTATLVRRYFALTSSVEQ